MGTRLLRAPVSEKRVGPQGTQSCISSDRCKTFPGDRDLRQDVETTSLPPLHAASQPLDSSQPFSSAFMGETPVGSGTGILEPD